MNRALGIPCRDHVTSRHLAQKNLCPGSPSRSHGVDLATGCGWQRNAAELPVPDVVATKSPGLYHNTQPKRSREHQMTTIFQWGMLSIGEIG